MMLLLAWLYLWSPAEPCWRLQLRRAKHTPLIVWVQL
jgi:hypothetical protein